MSVAVVIPAAGRGERLGAECPKAFVDVAGRTLLEHAVAGVRGVADVLVIAVPAEHVDGAQQLVPDAVVVAGGATRQQSVRAALAVLPAEADVVLIHDAARAFVPEDVVHRVATAIQDGADAVIPVVPVADTMKEVDAGGAVVRTVDRAALRAVQTPQGFRRDVIEQAHACGADATDDSALAEAIGVTVATVPGSAEAFKLTTPLDLAVAAALVARRGYGV